MSDANQNIPEGPVAPEQPRAIPLVALILAAGVAAGLVAWLMVEGCRDLIQPPRHAINSKGVILQVIDPREQDLADAENAGLAFAGLG